MTLKYQELPITEIKSLLGCMFIIPKTSDKFLCTLMLQNTGTTDGVQKMCQY
jgi:hypothetical protein